MITPLKFTIKLFVIACFAIICKIAYPDSGGKFNFGTPCSGCHGFNASLNTTVEIIGLPATFVPGTTYSLSCVISNINNLKAGYNIAVTDGELIAGAGSQVNVFKTQITHSKPMDAIGTKSIFEFSWIAPSNTNVVIFKAVGNAVNGNKIADDSDQWNTFTKTILSGSNFVNEKSKQPYLRCFPNPTSDIITLEGLRLDYIMLYNIKGQTIPCEMILDEKKCILKCSHLKEGVYFIESRARGNTFLNQFIKN